jgi:hypothetical protein
MFGIPDNRTGFSMKMGGMHLRLPDLVLIAAELGINNRDVLFKNGVLTVYNTSKECQEIVEDNALASFVAMALNISPEEITDITPVKAEEAAEEN